MISNSRDNNSLGLRIRRNVYGGLLAAALLSVVATVAYVFKSADYRRAIHITLPEIIGSYFLGGVFAGIVIALGARLLRTKLGSFIVYTTAALPCCLIIIRLMEPDSDFWPGNAAVALITALLFGGLGLVIRDDTS